MPERRLIMKKSKIVLALMLVLSMLFASSCEAIAAVELSADYTRTSDDVGEVTDEFVDALTSLSFSMFSEIVSEDEEDSNLLFSPLSAAICIAMVTNGADGETLSQLEDFFGMDIASLNRAVYAYISSLYTADDCSVSLANSIWVRNERITVKESFLQTNADWYGADAYSAPFDSSTVDDINKWCSDNTDGLIDKILDEIDDEVVMILINSLLFDAQWETKYENSNISTSENFTNYDGTTSKVTMMYSDENTYITCGDAAGIVKNYAGGEYAFAALLPGEDTDVYEFAKSLDSEAWEKIWEDSLVTSVSTVIPEFSYSYDIELINVMKALGVTDIFDGTTSDLSNLGSSTGGNLFVSRVEQKTYIEVSRNGTKAAAITHAEVSDECADVTEYVVRLDRPFVYAIVDIETGIPLFIGVYSNAEAE